MTEHEDEFTPEPSYDPWDAIDEALDSGRDPVVAHDRARAGALEWHLAVSGGGREAVISDYEARRRKDPRRVAYLQDYERGRLKRKRDRAAYMREYRAKKKAA